jgi:hypothetical protein
VEPHDPGVEVGQDRDAADDGLGGNAEAYEQRKHEQVASIAPQPHDERKHDDGYCDENEGQQAVTEFNCAVNAHLGCRDE